MINGEPINVNEINGSGIGTLAEQETIPSTATTALLWFTATLMTVTVPNVGGKTLVEATAILSGVGLNTVAAYFYSDFFPESNLVIYSAPDSLDEVEYGSDVVVYFSLGPEGT